MCRSTVELPAGTNCVRSQARSSSPCSAGSTCQPQVPAPANARSVLAVCVRSRKSKRCPESRGFASPLCQHVRRPAAVTRPLDNRRETVASPGALHGFPLCVGLRIRRSSIRASRDRLRLARQSPPAHKSCIARCNGLVNTLLKLSPFKRSPSRRALRSPRSVNGRSVSPVCWPERLHAVSPCLAR